jgi:NAD(P)-dependent dehydrogenase (short-subunit alcohol dehydrogenase family)
MAVKALAANGASKIYVVGRRVAKLQDIVQFGAPGVIVPVQGDVTKKEDLQAVVDKVTAEVGYVNLLIANSGISGPLTGGAPRKGSSKELRDYLWKPEFAEFSDVFDVNVSSVYYTSIAFLELLDAGNKKKNVQQDSQVITTGSMAAYSRTGSVGIAYASSKAATHHLVKQLSTFLSPQHIRFNAIAPGIFPSEMADGFIRAMGKVTPEIVPLERVGDEQDLAGAILYLASRAGAYCNGNILVIDGGRLSTGPSSY